MNIKIPKPNSLAHLMSSRYAVLGKTLEPKPNPKITKLIKDPELTSKPSLKIQVLAKLKPSPKIQVKFPALYPELANLVDGAGRPITLDPSQLKAMALFLSGSSFVIIGKAGTGKSTIVQAGMLLLLSRSTWQPTEYRIKGKGIRQVAPGIATVAYTNRAATNIRDKLIAHPELANSLGTAPNITTIHNLLEYTVEFNTDPLTGVTKRRYYPLRDRLKRLEITHIVIEEASMVGVGECSIWQQLFDALPTGIQLIFLGDINQLPPVIGKSILAYALQELPIVELDTIHRCALDNPIIAQAHNCISGKPVFESWNRETKEGIRLFHGKAKIKLCAGYFQVAFRKLITKMIDAGEFDPMVDMVLSPFFKLSLNHDNSPKAISACNIARDIAWITAKKRKATVYEIRAGFQTLYLAIGDRVILDKQEGIVTKIELNAGYTGKTPKTPSTHLNYFGEYDIEGIEQESRYDFESLDLDAMITMEDDAERKRAASHIITIKTHSHAEQPDQEFICSTLSDYATLCLGYALSVHKAQGSEWPNVILALHDSNSMLLFRELVYTGMTRARKRIDIVAQKHVLDRAIGNQRIKGDSLEAKIEFFNGGYLDQKVSIQP